MRSACVFFALAILAAGCGGDRSVSETAFGQGAQQVWLFRPSGKPRSVVVFLHGLGGRREETPYYHRPWLEHLAGEGSAVIYPRYERGPTPDVIPTIRVTVSRALRRLGHPHVPIVALGYSRGGRLAVEYAAYAPAGERPRAVLSVFPGLLSPSEPHLSLAGLDPSTRLVFMYGDRDTVVSGEGVRDLLHRFEAVGFPANRIRVVLVRSTRGFKAGHFAPLRTSTQAKRVFWQRADDLVDSIR